MKDFLKAVVIGSLFLVPFLTLYVEDSYFFPFITGKNFWFRIIVDVAFAAWVLLALYDVRYRPKFSGIFWSFGVLVIIMFFANLFGAHPRSSFWSNFERMDGYVSLIHTFMYMLVLGSVLQKNQWKYLLNTSLGVSVIVAIYGLLQYLGIVEGSSRIESYLGNAAYMAVYMLFHIFITFWLFIKTENNVLKALYALLAVMFTFVLVETGTRGTAVGLVVGVMTMSAYIGIFGAQFKQYRKYAIGGVALIVLAIGGFVAGKDSEFIQSSPNLARIANISLDDLTIRATIWGMAFEGAKERPLLGYGQSNFNYVFNEQYEPSLYAQEQWFDRAHNIFMDWLVAGGILGLVAYLSIFGWCVYYLLVRPMLKKDDETFSVVERGVLLGLLAGYFTHNLVVFDNIVSYIFFAIILGLIHSRVGVVSQAIEKKKVDPAIITQVALPVVGVALVAGVYVFHVPGMQAAGDIIDAFQAPNPTERLAEFESALERDSFAHQEISEQLSQQAITLVRNPQVPEETKQQYAKRAEEELLKLAKEKPGDARIHVFIGSYYRSIGEIEKAAEQMALARSFSPKKQPIIIQQGFVELSRTQNEAARDFFKEAFLLDQENQEARGYFAASLFYAPDDEFTPRSLMKDEETKMRFAGNEFIISSANQTGDTEFAIELFEARVQSEPNEQQNWAADAQNWATLAFLYYQNEQPEKAIETLEKAKIATPDFALAATCFAENIAAGNDPQEGCS